MSWMRCQKMDAASLCALYSGLRKAPSTTATMGAAMARAAGRTALAHVSRTSALRASSSRKMSPSLFSAMSSTASRRSSTRASTAAHAPSVMAGTSASSSLSAAARSRSTSAAGAAAYSGASTLAWHACKASSASCG